ncbi:MAG: hypothetical protein Q4E42_01415 [Phascolarctobacterium sp.]|nr:hypothetical protein [Phascolarctobacterium sp.]
MSDENTMGSVGNWFLEKGLTGVRKFYEKKVEFINKISDIKPEWTFYDGTMLQDYGKQLVDELHELETTLGIMGEQIEEIENRTYDIDKDDLEEIESTRNELKLAQQTADDCIERIKTKASEVVKNLALVPGTLEQCKNIARDYELETDFVKYEIPILEAYEKGEMDVADDLMFHYYDKINDSSVVEHPLICLRFAEKMKEIEVYEDAIKFMSKPICWQPENIGYHKTLKELYQKCGKHEAVQIEEKIINLLSDDEGDK